MRIPGRHTSFPVIAPRRFQSEMIRNLKRSREKARLKNCLNRGRRFFHRRERRGKRGSRGWQRQQTQSYLGHDSEHRAAGGADVRDGNLCRRRC